MSYLGTAQDDNEGGGQGISNIEQGISNDEGQGTEDRCRGCPIPAQELIETM